MNVSTVDNHLTFSLGNLTYIDSTYDSESAPSTALAPDHRVLSALRGFLHRIAEWQHRRAVMQELAMMSDRELSDIGLSRADLPRVFDPTFSIGVRATDYMAY